MGKIIALCGFDDCTESVWKLAIHTKEVTGKEKPNFLLLPTSAFDDFNRGTLNTYHKLGCNVDKLLLTEPYINEKIIAEKIRWADMISVPGGNLKFLMEKWTGTGAANYIREAYENGTLLFGGSAGSMCWFAEGYDNCGIYDSKMFTGGMGLRPYTVCPHYESPNWQCFNDDVKDAGYSSIAVEDGAALCLIDGNNYIFTATGTETVWYFDKENSFRRTDLSVDTARLKSL